MGLFGRQRDIKIFRGINRELINDIISEQVGYYKYVLEKNETNIYGENTDTKYLDGPFLINCLIERSDPTWDTDDFGPQISRTTAFNFLRDDLTDLELVPQVGDIVLYVDDYYEIDSVVENEYFVGKNPDYAYQTDLEDFGWSISIKCTGHRVPADKYGLSRER